VTVVSAFFCCTYENRSDGPPAASVILMSLLELEILMQKKLDITAIDAIHRHSGDAGSRVPVPCCAALHGMPRSLHALYRSPDPRNNTNINIKISKQSALTVSQQFKINQQLVIGKTGLALAGLCQ